jgi:hypothetical protein
LLKILGFSWNYLLAAREREGGFRTGQLTRGISTEAQDLRGETMKTVDHLSGIVGSAIFCYSVFQTDRGIRDVQKGIAEILE